jgi:hypothetical protein
MRCFMKIAIILVLVLLTLPFILFPSQLNAEKVTTVEGIIQHVGDNTIEVRGHSYDISGVMLLDSSGKALTRAYLQQGKKVEIFFNGKKITSILVYKTLAE